MYQYNAKILDVVDADTMLISIDLGFNIWHTHKFRILKYDAPEISKPKSDEELQLGLKAKSYAEFLLPKNGLFVINTHKDRLDKYGRYLCDILLPNGKDFAKTMIEKGFIKPTL